MATGELWRSRLMLAFARLNVGADLGDETRMSGWWTPEALAMLGRSGRVVLNDPHKLWVYESTAEEPLFIATNPIPPDAYWVSSPHERLEAALADAIATGGLSREGQVSYGLYAGSFGLTPEPRFAMLMMALESLIKLRPRSEAVQSHIMSMIEATKASELPSNEVNSICGSLSWLLEQSIGQAGRELAVSLGQPEYLNGEAPAKFFTECYTLRSRLLHGQHPIPTPTELNQRGAPLEHFVADLIARTS
jgi:hypothetical protein